MAGLGDIFKKAFYLGVGLASYAGERAGSQLRELQAQAQQVAQEMVNRGEMSTEEARRWLEDFMRQANATPPTAAPSSEPERIEIEILASEPIPSRPEKEQEVDSLQQQVQELQAELRRLQQD